MREIKFRAWHKALGMYEFSFGDERKTINEEFAEASANMMQYTGLKDKSGVEIYEGDIIKSGGYSPCEIVYIAPKFMALWKNKNNLTWDINSFIFDDIEVVGNIYENKELLNG